MRPLIEHMDGLRHNLVKLGQEIDRMSGPEYCPPNACCPSCAWGERYTKVEAAIERREHYLRVLTCRLNGWRPKKTRMAKIKRQCGACGGEGRTTKFSIGACRCDQDSCPGRGRCHTCLGRGWVWGRKPVVVRPWPEEMR